MNEWMDDIESFEGVANFFFGRVRVDAKIPLDDKLQLRRRQ